MDSVKLRLDRDQELSFIEFNYMLLQAYDFAELARRYGCNLQMGGSDQWGNIVTGIDLGRRMGTAPALRADLPAADHGVRRQDGQDRGRRRVAQRGPARAPTTTGNSGATPRTRDVARFLKLFTTLPLAEIARWPRCSGAEINEAKKVLATEATALLHGREKAEAAAKTAQQTFEHRRHQRKSAHSRMIGLPRKMVPAWWTVRSAEAILKASGLVKSNVKRGSSKDSEGAVEINDMPISDNDVVH